MHRTMCAVCGSAGPLHRHHLIPRTHGGGDDLTVMLCLVHHGEVHGRAFHPDHRALTLAGMQRAKARGVKLGNPNLPSGNATAAGVEARVRMSIAFAASVLPHIQAAQASGITSLRRLGRHPDKTQDRRMLGPWHVP